MEDGVFIRAYAQSLPEPVLDDMVLNNITMLFREFLYQRNKFNLEN